MFTAALYSSLPPQALPPEQKSVPSLMMAKGSVHISSGLIHRSFRLLLTSSRSIHLSHPFLSRDIPIDHLSCRFLAASPRSIQISMSFDSYRESLPSLVSSFQDDR
jgi:hypothetical protein